MGWSVNEEAAIFEFEKDFAGSLRCIPMIRHTTTTISSRRYGSLA
jgi:hypothetical protein